MSTTKITWRDAQLMPEDGKRDEAIDGELYVTLRPRAATSGSAGDSSWS